MRRGTPSSSAPPHDAGARTRPTGSEPAPRLTPTFMKLQTVPPRQGALWVRRGFAVFFQRPIAFAGLFAAFLFGVFALLLVPILGAMVLLALLPAVSLGFMIATRQVLDGSPASPRAFLLPLRSGRPRQVALLQLGAVYAAATFLIMWLADAVDGGALEALMEALPAGGTAPDVVAQKLADPRLGAGLTVRLGLAALLSIPFWHAPALVYWGAQTSGKALFFSTVACWRNKGAFVVYSLTWMAVILLFAVLANLVFALIGAVQFVAVASMPASLLFSTVFYASLYFTFAACFVDDTRTTAASAAEPAVSPPA